MVGRMPTWYAIACPTVLNTPNVTPKIQPYKYEPPRAYPAPRMALIATSYQNPGFGPCLEARENSKAMVRPVVTPLANPKTDPRKRPLPTPTIAPYVTPLVRVLKGP